MHYEEEEEEEEQLIDPKDLIIINNPKNWEPTQEQILAYAEQLGFDTETDPEDFLRIAYSYLKKEIPSDWRRAFTKVDNQLLYIDLNTNEIHLSTDIEENAKADYLQLKEQYKQKIKKEEEDAKKVKVVPRKKIPPIGQNKIVEDKNMKKEKRFIEKVEREKLIQRKKNFEEEDEETKKLNEKLNRDKLKEEKFKKENQIYNNEDSDDDDDYNSYNKYKTKNDDNNINLQDNNEDDSEEEKEREKKRKKNNKFHGHQQEIYEDEEIKNKIKKNKNKEKEREKKNKLNLDLEEEKESDKVIDIDELNNINYNNNNKFLNKNEKNFSTPEREKLKKETPPKIEKHFEKKEYENEEEEEEEEEEDEEENNNQKKDYTRDKNDFLRKVKKDLNDYEKKLKEKLENDKNEFIQNFEEEYEKKIIMEKRKLKDQINKLEKEFMNDLNDEEKFENEIENYKKIKREEFENEKKYSSLNINNEYENDINKLQREKDNLISQIKIQKLKNENEKNQKERNKNELLKNKQFLINEQTKNKKTSLNNNNQREISKIERELEEDFNEFKKEINERKKNEIKIINENNNLKQNNEINEILKEYQNNLDEIFENQKLEIKKELDEKMHKELEDYKKIKFQDSSLKKSSINSQQGDLGKSYLNELDDLRKKETKETEKKEKEIKEKFERSEKQLETFKNDMKNNIDNFGIEIINKIKEIINKEKNDENFEKVKSNINEYLSGLFGNEAIKFKNKKSLYDMVEKNYKEKKILINYFIEILSYIQKVIINYPLNNILDSNENKKMEENQINELIQYTKNKIEEYKNRIQNELTQKLFPFLENASTILNQTLNNINVPMPNTYLNMTSDNIMDNYNKNLLNQTLMNQTMMNQTMRNPNINLNPNISYANNNLNNNQILNPNVSLMNIQRNNFNQNYDPMNTTLRTNYNSNFNSFKNNFENPNDNNNYLNQTMNNIYPNNLNASMMEQSYYNHPYINLFDSLPEIPNEIRKNFSDDDFKLYNQINDFLIDESNKLNREFNEYEKKKFYDNQISQITEQGHYLQLSQMINDEKIKSIRYGKYFSDKIQAFNLIKGRTEECYKFVIENSNRKDIFKDKFNLILQHIRDYNKTIKSMKNPIEQESNLEVYSLRKSPYSTIPTMNAETIKNNYTNFYTYYNPGSLDTSINTPFSHQFFNTKKNNDILNMRILSNTNPINYSNRIDRFDL